MSLAQARASKRYRAAHREQHLQVLRDNYHNNKERYLKASHKRTREITVGARRWRKIVGSRYWVLINKSDLE